jgi:hypothetical protein
MLTFSKFDLRILISWYKVYTKCDKFLHKSASVLLIPIKNKTKNFFYYSLRFFLQQIQNQREPLCFLFFELNFASAKSNTNQFLFRFFAFLTHFQSLPKIHIQFNHFQPFHTDTKWEQHFWRFFACLCLLELTFSVR